MTVPDKCPFCGSLLELTPWIGSFVWACPKQEDGKHPVPTTGETTDHTRTEPSR